MKQPEDVHLSRGRRRSVAGAARREHLDAEDRQVLGKVVTFYFWLLFALREAKLSLKRVKALVFGEKPKKREPPSSGGTPNSGSGGGTGEKTGAAQDVQTASAAEFDRGEAAAGGSWATRSRRVSRDADGGMPP